MLPSFSKSSLKIVLSLFGVVETGQSIWAAEMTVLIRAMNWIIYLGTGGAAISNAASLAGRPGLDSRRQAALPVFILGCLRVAPGYRVVSSPGPFSRSLAPEQPSGGAPHLSPQLNQGYLKWIVSGLIDNGGLTRCGEHHPLLGHASFLYIKPGPIEIPFGVFRFNGEV